MGTTSLWYIGHNWQSTVGIIGPFFAWVWVYNTDPSAVGIKIHWCVLHNWPSAVGLFRVFTIGDKTGPSAAAFPIHRYSWHIWPSAVGQFSFWNLGYNTDPSAVGTTTHWCIGHNWPSAVGLGSYFAKFWAYNTDPSAVGFYWHWCPWHNWPSAVGLAGALFRSHCFSIPKQRTTSRCCFISIAQRHIDRHSSVSIRWNPDWIPTHWQYLIFWLSAVGPFNFACISWYKEQRFISIWDFLIRLQRFSILNWSKQPARCATLDLKRAYLRH